MSTLLFRQALIIKPRWLNEIYFNGKYWEMRSSATAKRGTFGFIEQGAGLITGQFDLIDSLPPILPEEYQKHYSKHRIPGDLGHLRDKYVYPWVMSNIIKFDDPVPYSHPQGAVIWVNIQ